MMQKEQSKETSIPKFIDLMRNLTRYTSPHPESSQKTTRTNKPSTSASTPNKSKASSKASMTTTKNYA